jgi:hypothetical protein
MILALLSSRDVWRHFSFLIGKDVKKRITEKFADILKRKGKECERK